MTEVCRACLSAIVSPKYILFDNVSPDLFIYCTSIQVSKDDLPKTICDDCYDLLFKLSDFKKTCIQSHKTLLSYNVKSEKVEILIENLTNNENAEDWSFPCPQNLFMDEAKVNNNTVKEEFEDSFVHELDSATFVDEFELPKRKSKLYKKLKDKTAKKKERITCELCNKNFFCNDRFQLHKLRHQSKGKSLKCTPCNRIFVTLSGYRRHHASWHTRVKLSSVKCRHCGKIAKSQETLKAHEKLHGERRQFICNVCGKECSTTCILKAHLETHKENRERQYTCEHCGKKFYTKKILVSHVTRCHTGRRFICQICSYPFTDKYNLTKHLLNHEGKKIFKCEICDKGFTTRSSYVEHQRIHSGERPFLCTYCSKSFISKRRLTDHHRVHTGEKPHKCNVCDHSFAQRGTLTRHMKVHNRVQPMIN